MKEYKKPYEFSRDYKKLKELLDEGYEVVCFVDFWFKPCGKAVRDVCIVRKHTCGNYSLTCRGTVYRDYDPSYHKYAFEEAMEADNVEFIPPTKIE